MSILCRWQRLAFRRQVHNSWKAPIEDTYTSNTMGSLIVLKRLVKFSLVGLFAVGVTAWTAFEGVHMWVEKVELSREEDEETRKWEWDREVENWSGGGAGGTYSALGFMGRHAVRGAWIAQNWGTGSGTTVVGASIYRSRGAARSRSLGVVDSRLYYAQNFLRIAISTAEKKSSSGTLRPTTLAELLSRHANVLERMGSPNALSESRSQYERAWATLPGQGINSARVALKLGDLNHRLGDNNDALAWWARAIQLTNGENYSAANIPPFVPQKAPSSPLSQRTLTSTLVSLSSFYATSGQLSQAQAIEEASLDLLRSIRAPESRTSSSPPEALHALYLLHRPSLISIHLGEVLFALRQPSNTSIQWLTTAAQSSERVALALIGSPTTYPDSESKLPLPPSPETPLLSVYSKSRSMSKPARSLLRNARRSAAESWSLLGILNEKADGSRPEKVLECYERALRWVGVQPDKMGGNWVPGEGILESEWKTLWANYVRATDTVRDQVKGS